MVSLYYERPSENNINKEIMISDISNVQMSKVVYSRDTIPNIQFIDIELTEEQVENIVEWINTVPQSAINELNQIPSNISAGIVFQLKRNKEIRIQYDLEDIFISRTDVGRSQLKYSIIQDQLKLFFDEQLKGFYFGKDKVE